MCILFYFHPQRPLSFFHLVYLPGGLWSLFLYRDIRNDVPETIFSFEVIKLTSSETFYVVLSTFNERKFSYWNWLFINTCWNWTLSIGGKAYILALLTCWELLGRFKLNVIALQRFYLTQILKIFCANFNDFIISLLYLYTVTCYSSCSQYAVMMKTFCLVPESKSMVSEQYFFIGCFDGLLWLTIQPIFSLTHFQPMFHL